MNCNQKEIKEKVSNLNKWLEDFENEDSQYADVNLIGENEDYVRGYKDALDSLV